MCGESWYPRTRGSFGAESPEACELAGEAGDEDDYCKDGYYHPRHAGKEEPASAQGEGGRRRGAGTHPSYYPTLFPCFFSHNITTLQYYRLPSVTTNVTSRSSSGMTARTSDHEDVEVGDTGLLTSFSIDGEYT